MGTFFKLFLVILFIGLSIVGMVFWRISFCRKAYDTIMHEYPVSKSMYGIVARAKELGFNYVFYEPDPHRPISFSLADLNENQVSDIEKKLSLGYSRFDLVIIPLPPFLRWILIFNAQEGIIKSVVVSQLD